MFSFIKSILFLSLVAFTFASEAILPSYLTSTAKPIPVAPINKPPSLYNYPNQEQNAWQIKHNENANSGSTWQTKSNENTSWQKTKDNVNFNSGSNWENKNSNSNVGVSLQTKITAPSEQPLVTFSTGSKKINLNAESAKIEGQFFYGSTLAQTNFQHEAQISENQKSRVKSWEQTSTAKVPTQALSSETKSWEKSTQVRVPSQDFSPPVQAHKNSHGSTINFSEDEKYSSQNHNNQKSHNTQTTFSQESSSQAQKSSSKTWEQDSEVKFTVPAQIHKTSQNNHGHSQSDLNKKLPNTHGAIESTVYSNNKPITPALTQGTFTTKQFEEMPKTWEKTSNSPIKTFEDKKETFSKTQENVQQISKVIQGQTRPSWEESNPDFLQNQQKYGQLPQHHQQSQIKYSSNSQETNEKGVKSCKAPLGISAEKLEWKSKESLSGSDETWYVPIAHPIAYNNFNRFINGQNLRSNENWRSFCLKRSLSWRNSEEALTAFNAKAYIRNQVLDGIVNSLQSDDNGKEILTTYRVKTDGKSYILNVECWKTGESTWTVNSKTPQISESVKADIIKQITELGFNPIEKMELSYSGCALFEKPEAELNADRFPKCSPPLAPLKQQWERGQVVDFHMIGDSVEFKNLNNIFNLSYDFRNQKPLAGAQKTCFNVQVDFKEHSEKITKLHDQEDSSTKFVTNAKCKYLSQNLATFECETENGEAFRGFATKSDFKSFIVVYKCWTNGDSSWLLYSKNPSELFKSEKYEEIIDHVQQLGFTPPDLKKIISPVCYREQNVDSRIKYSPFFSTCIPPLNVMKTSPITWDSQSNFEGVELFDLSMSDLSSASFYAETLGENYRSKGANCFRTGVHYNENIIKISGYGSKVSEEFNCNITESKYLECISEENPRLSFREYWVKSDNLNWVLSYNCFGTGERGWKVNTRPGVTLSEKTKEGILKNVESMGFENNDVINYDNNNCEYSKIFKKRYCECTS